VLDGRGVALLAHMVAFTGTSSSRPAGTMNRRRALDWRSPEPSGAAARSRQSSRLTDLRRPAFCPRSKSATAADATAFLASLARRGQLAGRDVVLARAPPTPSASRTPSPSPPITGH
jgi:hypothetical protein